MKCQICGHTENNKTYHIKEMMFGSRESFVYFECKFCGCLQIDKHPNDMGKYYPSTYYSPEEKTFQDTHKKINNNRIPHLILKCGLAFGKNIGITLARIYDGHYFFSSIANAHTNFQSKILEVGCGKGVLLSTLEDWGYKNVVGADLFTPGKIQPQLQIIKANVESFVDNGFELVVFDHSFEHMADQLITLARVSEILSPDGICVIRMPLKTDTIWKLYDVNWVQADAPRHFFIHTLESFRTLAEQSDLEITKTVFDSTSFQFWGSEQYMQDIPLKAENSYGENKQKSIFTEEQIKEFEKMAKDLNKNAQGDQAQFFLRKRMTKQRREKR